MTYLIRCHALGNIMGAPKSIDPALLDDVTRAIAKKKVKTDEDKAILEPLWDRTLSEGAKSYLRQEVRRMVYGYSETFSSRQTEKGIRCEDESIALFNDVFLTDHVKNTERRSNQWVTGECDIPGADIKSSWSLATFPAFVADAHDTGYEWQSRGYMMLWEMDYWDIAYCMVDTPADLVGYESHALHVVSHIPENRRITVIRYRRDLAIEQKIKIKCEAAQAYVAQMLEQFKVEHQE